MTHAQNSGNNASADLGERHAIRTEDDRQDRNGDAGQ